MKGNLHRSAVMYKNLYNKGKTFVMCIIFNWNNKVEQTSCKCAKESEIANDGLYKTTVGNGDMQT